MTSSGDKIEDENFPRSTSIKSLSPPSGDRHAGRGPTNSVLVVNDAPDSVELMKALLRQSGYDVLTAFDGQEAFELALASRPGLVISDVSMPRLDGIELCRLIRSHPELRTTPVLLVSAKRKDSASVVEGLKAGADDYLEAPYDPIRLVARVSQLIERRRADEALRASEAEMRVIFETMTDVILVMDAEGRYLKVAPTGRDLFYRPPEGAPGKTVHEIFPKEKADLCLEYIGRALREGRMQRVEFSLELGGREVWFDGSVSPMSEDRVVWVARDITERKRVEERLRQSENQLAEAQKLARVGSWNWDMQTNTLTWSEELYSIYGLNPQEFEPSYELFLERLHPDDREFVKATVERALKCQEPFSHYKRVVQPNGEVRVLYSRGHLVCDGQGRPIRMFGTAQDVTELRRAEEQLKSSNEELRALSARLQNVREEESLRIAREIHDELGGALTGLKMDLAWLDKRLSEPDKATKQQKMRSMLELIDETIQKVRNIATELRPAVLDDLGLAAAIEWQAREFQNRTEIECRLISLREDVTLGPEKATALFRIFQEILTNVARHARATAVEIRMEKQNGELILEVTDDGRGIEEGEIANTRSLGLLGMRERALVFGGRVQIARAEGTGTRVTISIPHD